MGYEGNVCVHACMCVCVRVYVERASDRERERESLKEAKMLRHLVSRNFFS